MSQRFEINTGVICAEDGGGRCPDGAPSIYSRPFSPSWPRLTALRLAGGWTRRRIQWPGQKPPHARGDEQGDAAGVGA